MVRENSAELIDSSQFVQLTEHARQSARKRAIHAFHCSAEDNPHRFLNAILDGSYVAPHRHASPPKAESFVVLQGELGVLLFGEDGRVLSTHRLRTLGEANIGDGVALPCGIDLLPGIWHSIVALSPVTVIFEVKPGPYDAATDKDFAPWAPREGDAAAPAYLAWMERQFARP